MIRLAELSDVEQLVQLYANEFADANYMSEEIHRAIDIGFVDNVFLVYEQDGVVLGFICFGNYDYVPGTHYIKWLVVREEHRNKSLGTQLVSVALAVMRNYQINYVMLMTQVPAFFQRFGFTYDVEAVQGTFKLMAKRIGLL